MGTNPSIIDGLRQLIEARQQNGVKTPLSPAALQIARQYNLLPPDVTPTPPPSPTAPQIEPHTAVTLSDTVKAYPDLLNAFLIQREAPAARLYMLLRAIDQNGRGWLEIGAVRQITDDAHMFTWRRLRQILEAGNGRFWDITNHGRIRYKSVAKLAQELNCDRLNASPVNFPVQAIIKSTKTFKAHCLAAWHAGQSDNNPITRKVLRDVTGVSETSQREYDKIAGTTAQLNIAITDKKWTDRQAREEYTWGHGRSVFRFVDLRGKQPHLKRYDQMIAYRLPNSYTADMSQAPRGKQRRINQKIRPRIYVGRGISLDRRYYQDAELAARAFGRGKQELLIRVGTTIIPKADRPSKLAGAAIWGEMRQ
jgi:hypothetical protein